MSGREYKRLHAEWYDLASAEIDSSQEIAFWARAIEAAGGPALELGSGTGRILIPLLEQGHDVVGVDNSADMMARCREAARTKGLRAELHLQSMQELDVPRRFALVFLDSGGLGLLTSDSDIEATFRRVMSHLSPGGTFMYEFQPPPARDETKRAWTGKWFQGLNDVVIASRSMVRYRAGTDIWDEALVIDKFVAGRLIETELDERSGRRFTTGEALAFATSAGFLNATATAWLGDDPPTGDAEVITVRCSRPADIV